MNGQLKQQVLQRQTHPESPQYNRYPLFFLGDSQTHPDDNPPVAAKTYFRHRRRRHRRHFRNNP